MDFRIWFFNWKTILLFFKVNINHENLILDDLFYDFVKAIDSFGGFMNKLQFFNIFYEINVIKKLNKIIRINQWNKK